MLLSIPAAIFLDVARLARLSDPYFKFVDVSFSASESHNHQAWREKDKETQCVQCWLAHNDWE